MITPGKRSRAPEPVEGGGEHRPEPTKASLWNLGNQLFAHIKTNQMAGLSEGEQIPLPWELYQELQDLISWAAWRIDRPLTREQIRYQRAYVVRKFIRQYVAQHGTERGSRKYAFHEAAKELTGPYAGSPRTMEDDYLFEEHAPSDDPRSVRYRERLERRARAADKKRAQRRRRR